MKKKLICTLLCTTMLGSMLVGCGNTTETTTDGSKKDDANSEAQATGDASEVVYWSMWNETEKQAEILKAAIADFEAANPDTKVTVEWVGRDVKNLVTAAIESGTQIDIFDSDPIDLYNTNSSKLLNLDEFYASESLGGGTVKDSLIGALVDWDKASAEVAGLEGNFSVPYAPYLVTWFYNKDMFKEAGIESVPTTWEEFDAACDKLVKANMTPITTDDAYVSMLYSYFIQRAIGTEATKTLAADGKNLWNVDGVKLALDSLESFNKKGYFSKNIETNKYPAGQSEFAMGNAAMYLNASWFPSEVSEMAGEDFPWGQFAYPEVPNGVGKITENTVGGQAFMVNAETKNKDAAFELLKYFISEKTQGEFLENKLVPCTLNTEWPAEIADQKGILSNLTANVKWNAAFSSEFVDGVAQAEFIKVITGKQTAAEAFDKINSEAGKY